jgi:hypothetical protein
LTPAEQDAVIEAMPAFYKKIMPKGFHGLETEWPTVADDFHLWAGPHVNDFTAYTVVKTFWEHIDEFQKYHRVCEGFNLKNALNGFGVIPMHPGAVAYYKEKGMWKDEHEKKQKALLEKEKILFKK